MLEKLKQQVCQANLDLVAHGLVTLTWGNVSGLSADGQFLVIKPSGVAYDGMSPAHLGVGLPEPSVRAVVGPTV